ncbi:MAG: hypothetical protein GC155_11520 [Alphaproteobacteria bacterium]|nr:hypothetical protein [Alphaproteobacteria bacterium]
MPRAAIQTFLACAALLAVSSCATPTAAVDQVGSPTPNLQAQYESDRRAILSMAGTFDVTFDFRETVAVAPGYKLAPEKKTGGDEVVSVIADTGRFISLQHILVVGPADDPSVVKHWRQDWVYEPAKALRFKGRHTFAMEAVPGEARKGAWSQTVYQVDDSPRYGGVGRWVHDNGVSTWTSDLSWRPLPRRDDVTRQDYDVVQAVNRHTITPWGWSHEQDNSKLRLTDVGPQEIVREVGVNSYRRSATVNRKPADDYWAKTAALWSDVRKEWARLEADGRPFTVTDDPLGTELYSPVLDVADNLADGAISEEEARDKIVAMIRQQTSGPASAAIAAK